MLVKMGSVFLPLSISLTFISFQQISVHISIVKVVQTWAGERQVRAVTLKGSREKMRFIWLALQIPLSMIRTEEGLGGTSEEEGGEGFRLQKMKKMSPLNCQIFCLIKQCIEQGKASPSARRRGPEDNCVVSQPVCYRC